MALNKEQFSVLKQELVDNRDKIEQSFRYVYWETHISDSEIDGGFYRSKCFVLNTDDDFYVRGKYSEKGGWESSGREDIVGKSYDSYRQYSKYYSGYYKEISLSDRIPMMKLTSDIDMIQYESIHIPTDVIEREIQNYRIWQESQEGKTIIAVRNERKAKKLADKLLKDGGDDVEIEYFDFSVRTYNCLKRANIHKLGELKTVSAEKLKKIRNLGYKSVCEMICTLNSYGIHLDCEDEYLTQKRID